MKASKLTQEILNKLKPADIIYAEFAEGGAMGACGTARIFAVERGKLKFYLVRILGDKSTKADETTWISVYKTLHRLAEQGELQEEYAGFGNTAWKQSDIKFARDDNDFSFIYEKDNQTYQIPASCPGVYSHIAAKFAEREISLEELRAYFNSTHLVITDEEHDFCDQYLNQCERADHGASWFDLTIKDYIGAIAYIHHSDGTKYILNPEDRSDCRSALQKYRLRYVVEKIGWNQLNKFFADFVKSERTDLFKELSEIIDEPVNQIFAEVKTIKSSCTELDTASDNNIAALFAYQPVLANFPPETHAKIIAKIQQLSPSSLRADAQSIAFYFANYVLNEDKLPLTDVLSAAAYVIQNIPLDDFNQTHADHLLWVAGEIINDAWKFLSEDEEKQKQYRKFIYDLYWPRIGSLWPIANYNQFEFKDKTTDEMFNDILSFVICLKDLTNLNPNFEQYLRGYTPKKYYTHEMVRRKAFTESLKDLSPREQFNRIMAFENDIAWFYLTYPEGIEEAKILLTEIFKKQDNKFTTLGKFATLESLIITPNTMGVGEYILNYLDQHFDGLVEMVYDAEKEGMGLDFDPNQVLADLFIAMTQGVSEENEFPSLKSIGDKLITRGADKAKISSALKYARKRRRTILFQRSALAGYNPDN